MIKGPRSQNTVFDFTEILWNKILPFVITFEHSENSKIVNTKTGNDHKPPAHDHKPPANDHKQPVNNHKWPNKPFPNSSYLFFL